jgi:ankyrin repeat protein
VPPSCGHRANLYLRTKKIAYFCSMNPRFLRLSIWILLLFGWAMPAFTQDSLQVRFMQAVAQSDIHLVKDLLKQGADVNMSIVATSPNYLFFISRKLYLDGLAKSRPGEIVYVSPIHANADRADVKVLQMLRKKRVNIEAGDSDGKTPLMYALRNPGGEAYALYLLKKGANYRSVDLAGNTVMHYAAYGGNIEGLRMTAGGGVNINSRNAEGITPLHAAAVFSSLNVLEEIVGLGGDIHARDSAGMGALHYAAAYGDRARLAWIYAQASELNDEAANGITPLDIASNAKNADAVAFFKENGGRYAVYRYAEMLEAIQNRDPQRLRQVLADGADPNRRVDELPIIIAVSNDDLVSTELLIEAGAKVNVHDSRMMMALEIAIEQGNAALGLALVKAGATVTAANLGACMDQIAKIGPQGYWLDLVKAMLPKVPDIDAVCGSLQAPVLHYAAYLGLEDMVNAVLLAGAKVNAPDGEGWTALHWAVMKRDLLRLHLEKLRIAQALIAAGAQVNAATTAAKALPHTDPYLAKRIPKNATPFDLLTYALPKDGDIADLLTGKGGKSGLKAEDYFDNGKQLFDERNFQSAQLDFNRAIVADPQLAEAYYYRARCLSMSSLYVEVERDLDKAISLKPAYPEALMARAKARIELQKLPAAENDANLALRMGFPRGEGMYWRGKIKLRAGDRDAACSDFADAGAAGYADGATALKLYCK